VNARLVTSPYSNVNGAALKKDLNSQTNTRRQWLSQLSTKIRADSQRVASRQIIETNKAM